MTPPATMQVTIGAVVLTPQQRRSLTGLASCDERLVLTQGPDDTRVRLDLEGGRSYLMGADGVLLKLGADQTVAVTA